MRYSASEKLEIIELVEQSTLSVGRTLASIGIPRSTFYDWYGRYQDGGIEALEDGKPRPQRVWNKIPDEIGAAIVNLALDEPDLSPRELAVNFTDTKASFVSEASVYRLLKDHGLIASPAFILMKAADRFANPTTAPNQLWQTDFTYLKVIGWGWFYLSTVLDDFSRYILAWKLCTTMSAADVSDTLQLALKASGLDQVNRAGFRAYWRWKSQGRPGRPRIERELRDLIRRMSKENPLWGAPRMHGELLKLGFEIAGSTVSKYMIRRQGPPSQNWRTFLGNHADAIAAIDLCVVPTLTFERLFAFLVLGHGRRHLLWFAVTRNPTAEWLAQQIVEAFPWNTAPTYLLRDNDGAYGQAFKRRVRTMGIRDRPISPRSPWQNPYVERLIGTLRRDCLDHVVIFGARHLRQILTSYCSYYNQSRTHLSLDKDAPLKRTVQRCGTIIATPILSGLHHQYARI
jgi:transposase InsO family protein/transposase-like protein